MGLVERVRASRAEKRRAKQAACRHDWDYDNNGLRCTRCEARQRPGWSETVFIDCRERELVLASMHSPPPHYAVFDPRFTLEQQLAEMFSADDPSARNTIC